MQYKPTSAKNWSNFKLLFDKGEANIKHHTNCSVRLNDEAANTILQLSDASQHNDIRDMHSTQEQSVNIASEYKDLRSKVDKLMAQMNITKVQHQKESENTTPPKPKGTTKKESCAEVYVKDRYPIIYCHTHGTSHNLNHGSMDWKFPSDPHKKSNPFQPYGWEYYYQQNQT